MKNFTLELTEVEEATGVTLEQVAEVLPKCHVFKGDMFVMLPRGTSPALAGATARAVFGEPAEFVHLASGSPVYAREQS